MCQSEEKGVRSPFLKFTLSNFIWNILLFVREIGAICITWQVQVVILIIKAFRDDDDDDSEKNSLAAETSEWSENKYKVQFTLEQKKYFFISVFNYEENIMFTFC